jgi:hypothetical protein
MEDLTPEMRAAVKQFLRKMRGRDENLEPIDSDLD